MKYSQFILTAFLMNGIAAVSPVHAQNTVEPDQEQQIVDVQKSPGQLSMNSKKNARNVTMTIKGPDGFYAQEFLGDAGLTLKTENISDLEDGVYHYEFTASSDKPKKASYKDSMNNGRDKAQRRSKKAYYDSISQTGFIMVKNGQIVTDDNDEPAYLESNK